MAPTTDYAHDPYTWDNLTGWKSYRILRPFRGMYWDVRRRLPYYWSDIVDGFTYRTFAATVRIFFVNLLPALAFQLDMTRKTDGYFGINEALFSSALAALVFSTMSCQPLTVVGITGLISLFNYTIFDIAKAQGIQDLYPQFIAWVSIWAAITHWMAAVFNWCDYMRYITDFSSNAFGMYVGIIYMIKGVEELVAQFYQEGSSWTAGYLSIVIALCYWFSVTVLEMMGGTIFFKPWIRKMLSDYAYPIATIWWTGFSHIPGRIKSAGLLRIPHTRAFYPTVDRGWLVDFWNLPVKWVFVALPIGILLTLLFYYDHNVSSLTAQAKQFPLKKPAGFHWDFFLLGCTCFIGGIIGIPLPNGLVPQAPVHTDSCTEYVDRLSRSKEKDILDEPAETRESEVVWVEHNKKIIDAVKVHEQRISHFIMFLGFVGLMTGPFLDVLHTMPRALFSGVFFVVGWGSISSMNSMSNLLYIMKERRFIDPGDPRNTLKKWRIAYYIFWQNIGVACSVAISQTIAAIGFPVIIIALIPLRWAILPRIFTEHELLVLDSPTADAKVVLASMGGQPELPEVKMAQAKRRHQEGDGEAGVSSGTLSDEANGDGMRSRGPYKDAEELEVEREKAEKAEKEVRDGVRSTLNTGHA
jgi:boron transporter